MQNKIHVYARHLLNIIEKNSERALKSLKQEDFMKFQMYNSIVLNTYEIANVASSCGILTQSQLQAIDNALQNHKQNSTNTMFVIENRIM